MKHLLLRSKNRGQDALRQPDLYFSDEIEIDSYKSASVRIGCIFYPSGVFFAVVQDNCL